MAERNNMDVAKQAYATLCGVLDDRRLQYERNDEELTVEYVTRGDDMPMRLTFGVDAAHALVVLTSPLPIEFDESRVLDMMTAVAFINDRCVHGRLDCNPISKSMRFYVSNTFRDCVLGPDVFAYMLDVGTHMVDRYNEALFMLAKGVISMEKCIEMIEKV